MNIAQIAARLKSAFAFANYKLNTNGTVAGLLDLSNTLVMRNVLPFTWALKPAAAGNTGQVILVTDVGGAGGSLWVSDGVYWRPYAGSVILGGDGLAVSCGADVTEDVLKTVPIPLLAMGTNGMLRVTCSWTFTGSTNSKTLIVRFGGASGTQYLSTSTTTVGNVSNHTIVEIQNANSTGAQVGGGASGSGGWGFANGALPTSAVDTSAATTLVIAGQKASSGEVLTLSRYLVELIVP